MCPCDLSCLDPPILDDFSPTDRRSIVEIRLIPVYARNNGRNFFPRERGEKIVAASRKKRGISHDVMTRSEEVREEQWKYKRPGGDKSFSPSVFSPPLEYGRNSVLATRRGGLPNLLPSRSIFLLFEIALIHAYNILPFLLNLRLQFFIKKKKKKQNSRLLSQNSPLQRMLAPLIYAALEKGEVRNDYHRLLPINFNRFYPNKRILTFIYRVNKSLTRSRYRL